MPEITIDEIRERHAKYPWKEDWSHRHIDFLLAEVDRLKAARRIGELDNHHNALLCPYCNGPIKDEITRLQAENERLKNENKLRIPFV